MGNASTAVAKSFKKVTEIKVYRKNVLTPSKNVYWYGINNTASFI